MWVFWTTWWWWLTAAVLASPHLEREAYRRSNVAAAAAWQKRLIVSERQDRESADDFAAYPQHHLQSQMDQQSPGNSQLMLRSPRGQRQYDVPQIGE